VSYKQQAYQQMANQPQYYSNDVEEQQDVLSQEDVDDGYQASPDQAHYVQEFYGDETAQDHEYMEMHEYLGQHEYDEERYE